MSVDGFKIGTWFALLIGPWICGKTISCLSWIMKMCFKWCCRKPGSPTVESEETLSVKTPDGKSYTGYQSVVTVGDQVKEYKRWFNVSSPPTSYQGQNTAKSLSEQK